MGFDERLCCSLTRLFIPALLGLKQCPQTFTHSKTLRMAQQKKSLWVLCLRRSDKETDVSFFPAILAPKAL